MKSFMAEVRVFNGRYWSRPVYRTVEACAWHTAFKRAEQEFAERDRRTEKVSITLARQRKVKDEAGDA